MIAPLPAPAMSADRLIVPGKSIGGATLTMTVEELTARGGVRMLIYDDQGIAFAITSDKEHAARQDLPAAVTGRTAAPAGDLYRLPNTSPTPHPLIPLPPHGVETIAREKNYGDAARSL